MTPNLPDQVTHDGPATAGELTTGRWLTGALSLISLLFLCLLPWQAPHPKSADKLEQGWWAEPAFASGVTLLIVFASALALFIKLSRSAPASQAGAPSLAIQIEYSLYFIGFLFLMQLVGFGFSVLIFATLGIWRSGFKPSHALLYAIGLTAVLVVLFRLVLTVWFPPSFLSEHLPPAIGSFIEIYF
jgi:hypothetical protein